MTTKNKNTYVDYETAKNVIYENFKGYIHIDNIFGNETFLLNKDDIELLFKDNIDLLHRN